MNDDQSFVGDYPWIQTVIKPKCECGVSAVMKDAPDDKHSDYCPIYKAWSALNTADKQAQQSLFGT